MTTAEIVLYSPMPLILVMMNVVAYRMGTGRTTTQAGTRHVSYLLTLYAAVFTVYAAVHPGLWSITMAAVMIYGSAFVIRSGWSISGRDHRADGSQES